MYQAFRGDNTDGYTAKDLEALNVAWESLPISVADADDIAVASVQKHIMTALMEHYDRGLRGEALIEFYYAAEDGI